MTHYKILEQIIQAILTGERVLITLDFDSCLFQKESLESAVEKHLKNTGREHEIKTIIMQMKEITDKGMAQVSEDQDIFNWSINQRLGLLATNNINLTSEVMRTLGAQSQKYFCKDMLSIINWVKRYDTVDVRVLSQGPKPFIESAMESIDLGHLKVHANEFVCDRSGVPMSVEDTQLAHSGGKANFLSFEKANGGFENTKYFLHIGDGGSDIATATEFAKWTECVGTAIHWKKIANRPTVERKAMDLGLISIGSKEDLQKLRLLPQDTYPSPH